MRIRRNPNRPWEVINAETVEKAVSAISTLQSRHALKVLCKAWGMLLAMLFTLIMTVELAIFAVDLLNSYFVW